MARAAKSAALRLIYGDSDTDDNISAVDDIHVDVADVAAVNPSDDDDSSSASSSDESSESDDHSDESRDEIFLGKDGTQWQPINENHNVFGRANQANVLRPAPGLTAYTHQRLRDNPVLDSFLLFFSEDMIRTLVIETNRQGRRTIVAVFKPLTFVEMKAFLGLLILRGVYRAAGECAEELWSADHGRQIFSKTMTFSRFKLIRNILRFDNVETRQGRLVRDKLAAVRLLIDGFVDHSRRSYVPGPSITIDEQLYPWRGRCRYRQYMASKPAKYGLKWWLACDSDNYYCWNIQFYCGREEERGPGIPLGEQVVLSLTEPLTGSGRNVTCDNFFTSLSLARKLHEREMTLVGTMRTNRRELPVEFTSHHHRDLYSNMQATNNNGTCTTLLVSYVAKKNRVVNLLSTTHRKTVAGNDPKHKPDVIAFYNATKGGVDAADERVGTYSVKFKCRRWHVIFFCNILDLSALNAFVIHTLFDPAWNQGKLQRRRLFLIELGHALLAEHLQQQVVGPRVGRPALGAPVEARRRGACSQCPVGEKRKCTGRCDVCHHFLCKEHETTLCPPCANRQ